jgi:hypothetical protein
MFQSVSSILLAGSVVLGATHAIADDMCRPHLSFEQVRLSEIKNQERIWSATLNADASSCAATSGRFVMNFIRLKEDAPDMPFTEELPWTAGKTEISVRFWQDESVLTYSIAHVPLCACSDPTQARAR